MPTFGFLIHCAQLFLPEPQLFYIICLLFLYFFKDCFSFIVISPLFSHFFGSLSVYFQ